MTDRADFTEEEWTRLKRAPFIAGMAISLADPGGPIEALKETSATLKTVLRAAESGDGGALVDQLARETAEDARSRKNPLGGFRPQRREAPASRSSASSARSAASWRRRRRRTTRRRSARGCSRPRRRRPTPPRRAASWGSAPSGERGRAADARPARERARAGGRRAASAARSGVRSARRRGPRVGEECLLRVLLGLVACCAPLLAGAPAAARATTRRCRAPWRSSGRCSPSSAAPATGSRSARRPGCSPSTDRPACSARRSTCRPARYEYKVALNDSLGRELRRRRGARRRRTSRSPRPAARSPSPTTMPPT